MNPATAILVTGDLVPLHRAGGDVAGAAAMQADYLELINALFCEVNPIPVKAALAMMGLIEESYRMPLYPMSAQNRVRVEQVLKECGLID